jgi:hypothetical protein
MNKRQKVKTYFLPIYIAKKGKEKPMGAIEGGGKSYPAEALAFPSHARRGWVARQGRERASFPAERSDGNFSGNIVKPLGFPLPRLGGKGGPAGPGEGVVPCGAKRR